MSESKHDGLDADTIQKEIDRLTLGSMKELRSKLIAGTAQERFERLYLVDWDSAAEKEIGEEGL